MNRIELSASLAPYRGIAGVEDALARLLGGPIDMVSDGHLIAGHLVATDNYLGVYLATSSHFGLLEATSDGQMFSLFVPNHQIRRIALLEDVTTTRLTIEMNADRASINGTLDASGAFQADMRSGGYELTGTTEPERISLRGLQAALISVV